MAIPFIIVKKKVISLLADTEGEATPLDAGQLTAALMLDGIAAALAAICQKAPKQSVLPIAAGEDGLLLPADLYEIDGIQDLGTGLFLEKMKFNASGQAFSPQASSITWTDYPFGEITFSSALASGGTLYYSALWESPKRDDYDNPDEFNVELPDYLAYALCLHAASYCAINRFAGSAEIRQFNTKVDSGTPEDNPFQVLSDFLLRRFEVEMGRLQQRQRGSY